MSGIKPENGNIFDLWSMQYIDFLADLGRKFLPPGHWQHQPNKKNLYLTFDDGPSPDTTNMLLELLASEEASASFFLIGSQASRHPELVKNIAVHGHTIGSHSLNHKIMPLLSLREIESEIHQANTIFRDLLGYAPKLFRPPYGLIDRRAARCLSDLGMKIVYWGAVPEDWGNIGAERVAQRVLRKMTDGTIIVLHEQSRIAEQTLAATKQIVQIGKQRGFSFRALKTLC